MSTNETTWYRAPKRNGTRKKQLVIHLHSEDREALRRLSAKYKNGYEASMNNIIVTGLRKIPEYRAMLKQVKKELEDGEGNKD
ncbi:hypothetical protein [Dietzia sp. MNB45]|uniref:hypothetical protein n=1 Tax=Dietzia sp. MNB45 TaxID=3238800 RepID=UPI003F7E4BBA